MNLNEIKFVPRVCHRCDGGGCSRCQDSGYVRGPYSTPVPLKELSAPELNWHDIQKRRR